MTLSLFRKTVAVVAAVGAAIAFALPHPVAAAPPGPDLVPAAYPADDYEEHLRTALGSAFAGAWLADGGQQWIVGVTDPVLVDHLRAAGVQPRLVTHSEAELAAAMTALNQAAPPPTSVVGWYIDVTANAVVVEALPEGQAVAAKFVEASGSTPHWYGSWWWPRRPTAAAACCGGRSVYAMEAAARSASWS